MSQIPLPEKLRPPTLTGFVGQEHLTGKEGVIKKLITGAKETGFFPSLIFWGPPGSGKTTLARIIANKLNRDFFEFSAVNTSIKDVEDSKIIDGLQRTTAIMDFISGKIKPFGYNYLELKKDRNLRRFNDRLTIAIYDFDSWGEVGKFYIDMNENITHSKKDIQFT